jgi:hypothetical protein
MADRTIKAGSTSETINVFLPTMPAGNALGFAKYVRRRAAPVSFLSTELAAVDSPWAAGKFKLLSAGVANVGVLLRLDLPDAAIAVGSPFVDILVDDDDGSDLTVYRIDLVGYDPALGILNDINDEPVPPGRTWIAKDLGAGLVGELPVIGYVGTNSTYAVDFRNDLKANGRVQSVSAVSILSGTAGGITFGTPGREDSQAKVAINIVTAGTYFILCSVVYHNGDTQSAIVELIARASS